MVMSRPATLQDVADLSGVSRGTASRALTGGGRVAAATRAKVAAAAAELKYATNSGARNLRRARAGSIGLWLPRGMAFMEYYMHFAFGVVAGTENEDLTVTLLPGDFAPDDVRGLHVDGFVMSDVEGDDPLARAILECGKPVVTSEAVPPGMPLPTASVVVDHEATADLVLDRLREGGAKCIALLHPGTDQTWAQAIGEAAERWAASNRVDLIVERIDGVPLAGELHDLVLRLLAHHPEVDALLCVPEGLSVGILSTLRESGRSVPDDIQIVSYVDNPTLPIVQPPISAVDLRPREAGERAARLLVSLLDGAGAGEMAAPSTDRLEVEYHDRASTRPVQAPVPKGPA